MILATTIELLAPAAISLYRAVGYDLGTKLYIPGTALRGAIAEAYLDEGGSPSDSAFQEVFVAEKVRFQDHRLNGAGHWPASVRQCADYGDSHRLVDLLPPAGTGAPLRDRCPDCRRKLNPVQGFWQRADERAANPVAGLEVKTRRVAHSAIDPRTLATAREQFYSSRLICSGQQFIGSIRSDSEADASLLKILEKIKMRKGHIYLGRGRTRGQGLAELAWVQGSPATSEVVCRRLRRMNGGNGAGDSILFSVTLESTTLLYDEWLVPRELQAADLSPELAGFERAAGFSSTEVVAGWHAAAGLPKSEVTALSPGSCYLFRRALNGLDREPELERLAGILAGVENAGVGERRAEGFGEVAICSDVHTLLWTGEAQ